MPLLDFEVEDRKHFGLEEAGAERLEPTQHLSLRHCERRQFVQQASRPRPRCEHDPVGGVAVTIGRHHHTATPGLPVEDLLPAMNLTGSLGSFDVSDDRPFRHDVATLGLEDRHM